MVAYPHCPIRLFIQFPVFFLVSTSKLCFCKRHHIKGHETCWHVYAKAWLKTTMASDRQIRRLGRGMPALCLGEGMIKFRVDRRFAEVTGIRKTQNTKLLGLQGSEKQKIKKLQGYGKYRVAENKEFRNVIDT